jgi:hypothetical protein
LLRSRKGSKQMMAMRGTKQRVAALLVAAIVATTGAFAASAATADDAHALTGNTGNAQTLNE